MWYDFYREDTGTLTLLGEGWLDDGELTLHFTLPDVPVLSKPCKGMPMNREIALRMLAEEVGPRGASSCRLPQFGYWIRWQEKALQQELAL